MSCSTPAPVTTLFTAAQFDAAVPSLSTLTTPQKEYLITSALTAIHSFLGWGSLSLSAERTIEQCDGFGGDKVHVTRGPITKVHHVWSDVARYFNDRNPTAADVDYLLDPTTYRVTQSRWSIIRSRYLADGFGSYGLDHTGRGDMFFGNPGATGRMLSGRGGWPQGQGVVWVEYTCGYTADTLPNEIKMAVGEIAGYVNRVNQLGGFFQASQSYQDVSFGTQYLQQALGRDGSLANTRNMLSARNLVRPPNLMTH